MCCRMGRKIIGNFNARHGWVIHLLITFQFRNTRLKWHYVVIIINVWTAKSNWVKPRTKRWLDLLFVCWFVWLSEWVWWFEYERLYVLACKSMGLFVWLFVYVLFFSQNWLRLYRFIRCHTHTHTSQNKCRNRNYFKSKQQQHQHPQ